MEIHNIYLIRLNRILHGVQFHLLTHHVVELCHKDLLGARELLLFYRFHNSARRISHQQGLSQMRLEVGLSKHAYQRFHIVHRFFQIVNTRRINSLSTYNPSHPVKLLVKSSKLVVAPG